MLWLVEHLPEDSATVASMKGGKVHRHWTTDAYLLAAAVNTLAAANRQRAGKPMRKAPVQPPKLQVKGKTAGARGRARVVRVADIQAQLRRPYKRRINTPKG